MGQHRCHLAALPLTTVCQRASALTVMLDVVTLISKPSTGTAFDVPPNLPPRRSPGPPNYPPRPGVNPTSNPPPLDAGQTWQNYFENLPGFQPSAPPASQFSSAPYNPNTYGLMPSKQQSPVHPAFRQPAIPGTSSDTSTWGVNFNSNHGIGSVPPAIPPQLPVRSSCGNNVHNYCPFE